MSDPATRLAVVPGAPVLLSRHAGVIDPVPALRAACADAVDRLVSGARGPVTLVCAAASAADRARGVDVPHGRLLGEELLGRHLGDVVEVDEVDGAAALPVSLAGRDLLVLADGSACRGERAPGHLDPRAAAYDEQVTLVLRSGDLGPLRDLDVALGRELLAEGAPVLRAVARALDPVTGAADLSYSDDPFGVQYWVLSWTSRLSG